ncbi:ASCH domain protein [uncultured archaeon]|nr:ASCH domain protein [uncultured archaeon]
MKLHESPFERIMSGKKTIEVRLYDEKRQQINLGDIIIFLKRPELSEQLYTEVTGLLKYRTFEELVNDFPMSCFGCPNNYDKEALVEALHEHYTKEEEQKYGVLGIKLKLL